MEGQQGLVFTCGRTSRRSSVSIGSTGSIFNGPTSSKPTSRASAGVKGFRDGFCNCGRPGQLPNSYASGESTEGESPRRDWL